jgi:hypothetical protein
MTICRWRIYWVRPGRVCVNVDFISAEFFCGGCHFDLVLMRYKCLFVCHPLTTFRKEREKEGVKGEKSWARKSDTQGWVAREIENSEGEMVHKWRSTSSIKITSARILIKCQPIDEKSNLFNADNEISLSLPLHYLSFSLSRWLRGTRCRGRAPAMQEKFNQIC